MNRKDCRAVVAQQLSVASKTVSLPNGSTIARTARPDHDEAAHTVTVTYEVEHTSALGEVAEHT